LFVQVAVLVIMAASSVVQSADDTAIGAQTTRIARRNERIFLVGLLIVGVVGVLPAKK